MMNRPLAALGLLVLVGAGCDNGKEPIAPPSNAVQGSAERTQSQAVFLQAGTAANQAVEMVGDKTDYNEKERAEIQGRCSSSWALIAESDRLGWTPPQAPFDRDKQNEAMRGWRTLALVQRWGVEQAAITGDFSAVPALTGTVFSIACRLTGYGAEEAVLAAAITDEIREPLLSHWNDLTAEQLNDLAKRLEASLALMASTDHLLDNERLLLHQEVNRIAEMANKGDFDELEQEYGPVGAKAATLLRTSNSKEDTQYLKKVLDGLDERIGIKKCALMPGSDCKGIKVQSELADVLFSATEHAVDKRLYFEARMKLLALTAAIQSQVKATGSAPSSLIQFSKTLTTDPYTGGKLNYRAEGKEFLLYSVGPDDMNNGGLTSDEDGMTPDLFLSGKSAH